MKSLNFKRKGSTIRVMPEPEMRKHINWDRMVYFIFLLLLVGFLATWGFKKIFYIEANGQVMFENVDVRILKDCRVMKYYVMEDDTVKVGDTLFMYIERADDYGTGGFADLVSSGSSSSPYDWVVREMYELKKKMAVNVTEEHQKEDEIKVIEKEIPALKNQVTLDALSLDRLDTREKDLVDLQAELDQLKAENRELEKLLGTLTPLVPKNQKSKPIPGIMDSGGDFGNNTEVKWYLSPIDGSVNRIYSKTFETALKSEVIMSIHKNSPIYVRSFFNQSDMEYFKVGDEVILKFPDGIESRGVIRRFFYSTVALPEEFQKRYEPTTRSIAADIYPVDSMEQRSWHAFYKMGVEITKFKY